MSAMQSLIANFGNILPGTFAHECLHSRLTIAAFTSQTSSMSGGTFSKEAIRASRSGRTPNSFKRMG
jgi:hypothetical protein